MTTSKLVLFFGYFLHGLHIRKMMYRIYVGRERSRLANVVVVFIPVNRLKNINYTYKKVVIELLKRNLA
jgi:hypothetical protein